MKLCVNYLMELREIFEETQTDFIDYIKLYSINNDLSPFDWCVSKKDIMFHGQVGEFSNVGDFDFSETRDFELTKEYIKRGNTPYVSSHIARTIEDGRNEEEVFETIKRNVKILKYVFDMPVILENVPVNSNKPSNAFLSTPEFITKVVNECDTGFLFDIGHARVAAERLGIPFDEYVSKLPMDRVVELHLAGSMKLKDGMLVANHSKMNEEDYEFTKMALEKYPTLKTITLEYGPIVKYELAESCVEVSADSINQEVKTEVIEQLTKLNEIMKDYRN